MEKLILCSICLLTFVVACLADDVADENLIKTLLNDQSRHKLRDIVDELLLAQENPSLDSLLSVDEQQLSSEKRIFCNGAVGCINRMRRRKEDMDDAPVLKKRPFCNGFFGCGNGKRSYNVPVIQDEPEKREEKRLFCNMNGCGNMGKRTLYSTLLARLQPVSEEKSLNV